MPIADPRNRAISETRESNDAMRFKGAMESRWRFAISGCDVWAQNPSFCGISGNWAPSTRKSLAIAIVRFWCAKGTSENGISLGGRRPSPSTWGPPVNHSCAFRLLAFLSATWRLVFALIALVIVMDGVLSVILSCRCVQFSRVGQVTGQTPSGQCFLLVYFLVMRYGGGSLGGEACGLSVPRSLITTLRRVGAAHGPRHPAYSSQSCAACSWVCICFCHLLAI